MKYNSAYPHQGDKPITERLDRIETSLERIEAIVFQNAVIPNKEMATPFLYLVLLP